MACFTNKLVKSRFSIVKIKLLIDTFDFMGYIKKYRLTFSRGYV